MVTLKYDNHGRWQAMLLTQGEAATKNETKTAVPIVTV